MFDAFLARIGVVQEFIAPGRRNRPGTKIAPTTVTIHNTDNPNKGAGAKAHSRFVRETGFYMHNGKQNWVSWHFSVDDKFIIQHLPIDEVGYHAGAQANGSSIAIEICMNSDSNEGAANAKAADLAAHLIAHLGLGVGALRRHKDWTGKDCPSRLIDPAKWGGFVSMVKAGIDAIAVSPAGADLAASTMVTSVRPPAPETVEGFDIDHELIDAAVSAELSVGSLDGQSGEDIAGVLRRVVDGLSSQPATSSRLLFPGGITEITLALPAGVSVSIKGPPAAVAASAFDGHDHDHDHDHDHAHGDGTCEAPDDGEDEVAASADPIDTPFPASSPDAYAYLSPGKRFGRASVIRAIQAIAAAYRQATGLRLGVGNISLRGGGTMPPHVSHKRGVDVDLRVPRSDSVEAGTTWRDPRYSRERTRTLVRLIRTNTILPIRTILFNDPDVDGVSPWQGHDDHLHVSFSVAGAASRAGDADAGAKVYARARAESEVDARLADFGSAKVIVKVAPNGGTAMARTADRAAAAMPAEAASFGLPDDFAACFDAPDIAQAHSLAMAAAAARPRDTSAPPAPVTYFPRLGLAVGTVNGEKIQKLRGHRRTQSIHVAPELSLIREREMSGAKAPKGIEWGIGRIRADKAWREGYDGRGVVVGHLDTGFDASHPALNGALRAFAEFDLAGRIIPNAPARDSGHHGTHTAGTIAGRPVGARPAIGVAPGCSIASALVIEGGDVITRILGGLEWVVGEDAKVLSMSLGLRGYTDAFQVVVDALWENDILPVIAVGNEYANSSRSPGNYANVLSVGAMSVDEEVADFSSSQRFTRDSRRLVPNLVAPGVGVVSCVPGGAYARLSGTSMATPHVAGMAAILRQAVPHAGAGEVQDAIFKSCRLPTTMSPDRANLGTPDVIAALDVLGVRIGDPS